jgi:molybdopterin-guanine dinucleotide biosynthesis protein A
VVLAGGSATRFGSDKLATRRDGTTLLGAVLEGVARWADDIVAVGPHSGRAGTEDIPNITWTCEEPPGGGPVAALAAALAIVDTEIVLLLAGDAPNGPDAAPTLLDALDAQPSADAGIVVDSRGRLQTLCASYRVIPVRRRLAELAEIRGGVLAGAAMRDLVDGLALIEVPDAWGATHDIDTPGDADRLGYA